MEPLIRNAIMDAAVNSAARRIAELWWTAPFTRCKADAIARIIREQLELVGLYADVE
jgi:hypothetical protein